MERIKTYRLLTGARILACFFVLACSLSVIWGCGDNGSSLAAPPGLRTDPAHYGTVVDEQGLIRVRVEVVEPGIYDLKYQCCVVNNHASQVHNVLIQANLFINDPGDYLYEHVVKSKGFNVSWNNHYGVLTLLWVGYLDPGDVVEIQVRAQSGRGLLPGGVIIIDVQPQGWNANVWETFAMYRVDLPNTPETMFLVK